MPKLQTATNAGASRSGRGRRTTTSLAEINVVPLVDVMLVLLIIFMVTAPMIQRGIDVNLPVAKRAVPISGERIFVSIPLAYRRNRQVYLNDEPVQVEAMQERIRQKLDGQPDRDKQVYLRGDAGVQYQELMDVFDRLRDAGVDRIGLVGKLPAEK